MGDYSKLQELAEAATPGEWARCDRKFGGVVYGGPTQHWINGSGQSQIAMTTGAEWMRPGENEANADFIAAANPAVVLELLAENERLRSDYSSLAAFNPDWDRLKSAQDSAREHMEIIRQLKAENERLRKLPTCWTEVLEQSEANDELLSKVLELSRDAERWAFIRDEWPKVKLAPNGDWFNSCWLEREIDAAMAKAGR